MEEWRSVIQAEIDFVLTCHGATLILNCLGLPCLGLPLPLS